MTPSRRCKTLADPCVPLLPRSDVVRESRCRRVAKRQGRLLLRHISTGGYVLDGEEGELCLDEVESLLFDRA